MSAYSDLIDALLPLGYWRLNDASGDAANSAAALDVGVANGGLTYLQAGGERGDPGTSVLFNGTNGRFAAASSVNFDVVDVFTVCGFFRKASHGIVRTIMSRGTGGLQVRLNASGQLELAKSNTAIIVASTVAIIDTDWHHFAATKDGVTSALYLDGADVTGAVTDATITDPANALQISSDTGGFGGQFWHGWLDEIALLGTALDAGTIASLGALTRPGGGTDDRRRRR